MGISPLESVDTKMKKDDQERAEINPHKREDDLENCSNYVVQFELQGCSLQVSTQSCRFKCRQK